ncbi:hypothetical protein ACOMHN_015102 [Nucella lapillus]
MIYVSSAFGNVFGLSEDGEVHLRKGMSFTNPKGTQWHHIRRRDNGLATVDSLHGYFWATKNKTNANAVLYSYLSWQLTPLHSRLHHRYSRVINPATPLLSRLHHHCRRAVNPLPWHSRLHHRRRRMVNPAMPLDSRPHHRHCCCVLVTLL